MPVGFKNRYIRLRLDGTVQGVGLRPYIKRLADELNITGHVQNAGGSVIVAACAAPAAIEQFVSALQSLSLEGASLSSFTSEDIAPFEAAGFAIVPSKGQVRAAGFPIPPDIPICPACLAEARDPQNRRYLHPLISCASCGPRISIAEKLPYDRETTSMRAFPMCRVCAEEYGDPADRRFHAQTISCHDCGPQLAYTGMDGRQKTQHAALESAVTDIQAGRPLAVKGIGGYHIACAPKSCEAVARLRQIKGRDAKPFAVMFPDLHSIEAVCHISPEERALLLSPARPIVLLDMHADPFDPGVCAGSLQCGCFLPYTAIHHFLLEQTGPLVLTSANASDSPILTDDKEIFEFAAKNGFGILYHERKIVRPLEDSVARTAPPGVQLIRRARGYVPGSLPLRAGAPLLAFGGDLKAAFCAARDKHAWLSPPFGDLADAASQDLYRKSIVDYGSLMDVVPELAVCDLHPGYFSRTLAVETGLPLMEVQHHHAHALSVMEEHGLENAIGVVMDGTGYGTDSNIWGCEFLVCRGGGFTRAAHLAYTKLIGGDESMKDARKTAVCHLSAAGLDAAGLDERATVIQAALHRNVNTISASSAGRLFDAAASLILGCSYNRYEGECAIALEREAQRALIAGVPPFPLAFSCAQANGCVTASSANIITTLFELRGRAELAPALALGFHTALADLACHVCGIIENTENLHNVVLSGGVFQNALLLALTWRKLKEQGFCVYLNEKLPPNDGGIAYGQAAAARRR